jgi:hypothetical protein
MTPADYVHQILTTYIFPNWPCLAVGSIIAGALWALISGRYHKDPEQ